MSFSLILLIFHSNLAFSKVARVFDRRDFEEDEYCIRIVGHEDVAFWVDSEFRAELCLDQQNYRLFRKFDIWFSTERLGPGVDESSFWPARVMPEDNTFLGKHFPHILPLEERRPYSLIAYRAAKEAIHGHELSKLVGFQPTAHGDRKVTEMAFWYSLVDLWNDVPRKSSNRVYIEPIIGGEWYARPGDQAAFRAHLHEKNHYLTQHRVLYHWDGPVYILVSRPGERAATDKFFVVLCPDRTGPYSNRLIFSLMTYFVAYVVAALALNLLPNNYADWFEELVKKLGYCWNGVRSLGGFTRNFQLLTCAHSLARLLDSFD